MVGIFPSNRLMFLGNVRFLSMTNLTGFFPYQFLVVKDGLSNKAVFLPTKMALCSALLLCTTREDKGEESKTGLPPDRFKSMNPSADSAHFKVM